MARPTLIDDDELMNRLSRVFRDEGFAGASLGALSDAAGLKRASLYHRFPDGKEQMAKEVLDAAASWLEDHVISPLEGDGPPKDRLQVMARGLSTFYSGGQQACLLNLLSSTRIQSGPFAPQIKATFKRLIDALSQVASETGLSQAESQRRAERTVALLQGTLVMSRGLGTTRPFKDFLKTLPDEMLGVSPEAG